MNTSRPSRKSLTIVAIIALALPLVLASTATAGGLCENNPDHPKCTTTSTTTGDHPDGVTCAETQDDLTKFVESDGFTISLAAGEAGCVDWTTTLASSWTVTVDADARTKVSMSVRDSHPGDFCWWSERGELDDGSTLIPSLPISTIDACGTEYTDSHAAYVLTVGVRGTPSPMTVSVTPGD